MLRSYCVLGMTPVEESEMRQLMIMCAAAVLAGGANADILRVDDDANPNGDGSSWGRAFDSLTDALAAATAGDQIWVAGGTYIPVTPAGQSATFSIPVGVAVYGGFNGNESSLAQRGNPLSPPSTLNGQGTSYHVVTFSNAGQNTILDGFFITKGNANGTGSNADGGGIIGDNSIPTLANLNINLCSADSNGAAIYLDGNATGFATISDCTFENNSGGGVYSFVDVNVTDCTFKNNTDDFDGMLVFAGSNIQLATGCLFDSNTSSNGCGGIFVIQTSAQARSVITDCEFRDNVGLRAGAIEYNALNLGNHEIQSCRFSTNSSSLSGTSSGAIRFDSISANSSLLVENSFMTGNSSSSSGAGAVFSNGSGSLHMVNCTIVNNTSVSGPGGAVLINNSSTLLDNMIIFSNDAQAEFGQDDSIWISPSAGTVTVNRSIIQALGAGDPPPPGTGNISSNPLFVDLNGSDNVAGTADDDVRLQAGSPAIDRGNNLATSASLMADIYGDTRFVDDPNTADTGVLGGFPGVIDLGVAEFQPPPFVCLADVNHDGSLTPADFTAWIAAFNANAPECDQNGDGSCDPTDFTAWIANFNAGC